MGNFSGFGADMSLCATIDHQKQVECGGRDLLHLSTRRIETYHARSMQKQQLEDLVALVKFAIGHGSRSMSARLSSRSFYREFPT